MNKSDFIKMGGAKLNVGSGKRPLKGFINLDWSDLEKPDVVHDLNVFPYPFKDSTFDYIEMSHVLEHLDKPFEVMRELHRILKPEGIVHISVPHFSRGFTHAEHAHGFDVSFPYYFNSKYNFSGYYGFEFTSKKIRLHWMAFFHLMKEVGYSPVVIGVLRIMNSIINSFANLSPAFTSRIWCFYVGGFEEIEYFLEAKK